ncbi:MAG: hypothetical protein ACRD19_10940 [Terriglobia bacterium]
MNNWRREKTVAAIKILAALTIAAGLAGCGSADGGGGSGGSNNGYIFGERLGEAVYMQPSPRAYTFPTWSETGPDIRIDEVAQFASTVNPTGTDIYQGTTQFVFGQVTGPRSVVEFVEYRYSNFFYIQPVNM